MGIASRSLAQTVRLVGTGFTEAQARAITESVDVAASEAVGALRHELARWHAYLALYILMQIGVALLVILIVQAASPSPRSLNGTASGESISTPRVVRDAHARLGRLRQDPLRPQDIGRALYLTRRSLDSRRLGGRGPGLIDACQSADEHLKSFEFALRTTNDRAKSPARPRRYDRPDRD
jgi:hypothetical protein